MAVRLPLGIGALDHASPVSEIGDVLVPTRAVGRRAIDDCPIAVGVRSFVPRTAGLRVVPIDHRRIAKPIYLV